MTDRDQANYGAIQRRPGENGGAGAVGPAASSLAGAGASASSGSTVSMPAVQGAGTRPMILAAGKPSASVEAPVLVLLFVAAVACFGWWFSPALFSAEDAQVYTLCMGVNFAPWALQTLVYGPAALVLAFLGVELGMAIATMCHSRGVCAAPVRPKSEGALLALAVFCLGCSLVAHGAAELAIGSFTGDAPATSSEDMPLLLMLVMSVVAYGGTVFVLSPFVLRAKSYIGRFVGFVFAFVLASFITLILFLVTVFFVIGIIVAIGFLLMPIAGRAAGPTLGD